MRTFAFFCSICLIFVVHAASSDSFLSIFAAPNGGPVSLSPDGRLLAEVIFEAGTTAVCIVETGTGKLTMRAVVGKDATRTVGNTRHSQPTSVTFLRWASPTKVIALTSANQVLMLDSATKQARLVLNLNGEESILGSEYGILAGEVVVRNRRTAHIVALPPGEPDNVYIDATASGIRPTAVSHVVFKINLSTGRSEVALDEESVGALIFDPAGRLRASQSTGVGVGPVYHRVSNSGEKRWEVIDSIFPAVSQPAWPLPPEAFLGQRTFPVAFDFDPHVLYVASNLGRKDFRHLQRRSHDRRTRAIDPRRPGGGSGQHVALSRRRQRRGGSF